MLDLGSTEFYLGVPSVPGEELKRLSSSLFDSWEAYVGAALTLQDYSLFLQVEEGSVRGLAKIGAAIGVLYMGIGNYGDFISGVTTIGQQINATSEFLTERAGKVFSCSESQATNKKRGGTIAAIQRLFVRVQRGELTAEEASARAEALLGEESAHEPKFLWELTNAFRDCPRYHEQQRLPFAEGEEDPEPIAYPPPQKPRAQRSGPDLGPPLQLRVEVWRESKNKRKHTRLVKL
jgi:hypothetical protein